MTEPKKTNLFAFFSAKGGSGKTTIATQCAVTAKAFNLKVCFYDLDPQKTATNYFERIDAKFRPDEILHDFNIPPSKDVEYDFIMLDCEPSIRFIPPIEFTFISPTLASSLDMHAYRITFELEKKGYKVIRVLNQFSYVRNDDEIVRENLEPCVIISQNSGIRYAMNNNKTIFNSNHPSGNRAKNQFNYLFNRMVKGSAEKINDDAFRAITLKGFKYAREKNLIS